MLIGHPEPEVIQEFRRGFADYARENRIVSEFAHLHPWKSAPQCLDGERVSFDREIVYVDLEKPMEEIWTHSLGVHCRKHIRKAMRLGATWRVATQKGEIEHFYEIYIGTMKRREAAERYYLPLTYFTSLFELLPHNVAYFLVEYGDRVVTAGLCLYDDTDVYGYLGGMDREFEEVRPFNLMNYAIIQWGHETGRKRYLLGGGYRPGDGIFKFKASFSPLTEKFYLYRKVHDERLYGELVHGRFNGSTALIEQEVTYFPKYRAE
jgi:lipid II:glycine glycyltransferase (peptidoglycan interpeptide bridge formation enzyme)